MPATTVTPVGRGLIAATIATGALGVAAGYPMLVGLAVTWSILLILAAATVLVRPRLAVTRTVHSDRMTVGDVTLGQLVAHNSSRWPAPRLVAVDRIQGRPVELAIPPLPPGDRRTVRYPVPGTRRGPLVLGPVTIERRDPLGIFRRSRLVAGELTVWVRPRVHPVRHPPAGVVLDLEGPVRASATAGTAAFSALRDYALGDDPRHIHWKQSARTGRLMVKEHVDADEPTVTVVLDARGAVFDEAGFEEAVEVAASFALGGLAGPASRGRPAALRIVGEDAARTRTSVRTSVQAPGPVSGDQLDRLAAAEPAEETTSAALLRMVERIEPGGCVVVVTGDGGVAASMLSRPDRHALVVVAELHTGLDGATAVPRTSTPRPGAVVLRGETAVDIVAAWRRLGAP